MGKDLAPEKIDFNTSDPEASKKWSHWKRCLTVYLESIEDPQKPINKLNYLIRNVSHEQYEIIEEAKDFKEAIELLDSIYKKKINILFARHVLLTRRQKESETTADYLLALKTLAKECNFEPVDAIKNREHYIRDSFVAGLCDREITQKILESSETELDKIATLSQVYEDAKKNTEKFKSPHTMSVSCAVAEKSDDPDPVLAAASNKGLNNNYNSYRGNRDQTYFEKCGWCGKERHPKFKCPAKEHVCKKCNILGHYEKVCRAWWRKLVNLQLGDWNCG